MISDESLIISRIYASSFAVLTNRDLPGLLLMSHKVLPTLVSDTFSYRASECCYVLQDFNYALSYLSIIEVEL